MDKMFYEDRYFSILNLEDLKMLCPESERDQMDEQYRAIEQWLIKWTEPASRFNFEIEQLMTIIESACIDGKRYEELNPFLIVIAAKEIGYAVKEDGKDRPYPTYKFKLKLKKEAYASLGNMEKSGTCSHPQYYEKYLDFLERAQIDKMIKSEHQKKAIYRWQKNNEI